MMSDHIKETTGMIFDIQRFSVHDGPGIRTLVFLKGCSLRCRWCGNPEGLRRAPQLLRIGGKCRGCGKCVAACPQKAVSWNKGVRRVDNSLCRRCGACAEACVFDALQVRGKPAGVQEVMAELRKDAVHYGVSGGGITLSGGEALLQPDFCAELLRACRAEGWNTAVETSGNVPWRNIEKVLPWLGRVFMDIKHAHSAKHRLFTRVPNRRILNNARLLASMPGVNLAVRVPVIPQFNDTEDEIAAIARVVKALPNATALHLLPFHRLGANKYDYLNMPYAMPEDMLPPSAARMEELRAAACSVLSIPCYIGG